MDPHLATSLMLMLCLVLVVATYVLGVEAGAAAKLTTHPGYEAARWRPAVLGAPRA